MNMDDLGGKKPYFWFNTHFQLPQKNMVKSTSYLFFQAQKPHPPNEQPLRNPGGEESQRTP